MPPRKKQGKIEHLTFTDLSVRYRQFGLLILDTLLPDRIKSPIPWNRD